MSFRVNPDGTVLDLGCDGCWENSNYPEDQCCMEHDRNCPSNPDYIEPPKMPKIVSGRYWLSPSRL
jgi:hypothetical protein